jgi:hypothetical protein
LESRHALKLNAWSAGKLVAVAAAIIVGTLVATAGLSVLVLDKSYRIDEERATVFLSFEGHPECGTIFEYANPVDLEAGDVISGDPSPCEYRNLVLRVLQVLAVMAAIGALIGMLWAWLATREDIARTPGPGQDRAL